MPWFILRAIDPVTDCCTHEVHFETSEVEQISNIIDISDMDVGDSFELSSSEYASLVQYFKLDLPVIAQAGELWQTGDNFDSRPSHTGRELLLMLEGKKPFSAFLDTVPITAPSVIPEAFFDRYVVLGRLVKKEVLEDAVAPNGSPIKIRRVMYALPGQEWRFDAFLSLWKLASKHGWNEGFEMLEGFLYGYETEIDPFFEK